MVNSYIVKFLKSIEPENVSKWVAQLLFFIATTLVFLNSAGFAQAAPPTNGLVAHWSLINPVEPLS